MEDSNLKKIRIEKIEKLKELGINPFPYSFDKKNTVADCLISEGKTVKTAGRLFSFREHGNIAFADLGDETGKIQIFFQKKVLGEAFKQLRLLDLGDFIGVEGKVGKTIAGEISIIPTSYTLLSKSLRPLPNEWYGLKDIETRYRQRYVDLLLNPEVRQRFNIRTKLISGVREYLDNLGFWEVETPVLQSMYGGTNAKPFTTYLNALGQDMYLRIADELYIKRLLAGGYERVYEISKDFRNEGIDQTHSPEFTMIEWYEAYVDYHTMMDRAEGLIKFLAQKLHGTTKLQVDDKIVDVGNTWPRISMIDIMKEKLDLDVEKESAESLLAYLQTHCPGAEITGGETKGQLIFAIFDHLIPKMLKEPTWIIDYPKDISPLARPHREKEGWVERYEGYIGGKEIMDGWTEITDARIQRHAWENDQKAARRDKEEAQHVDEDFLTMMEYGLPPYGGIGIGIDRLTMLFTNTWAIKELILFPLLKTEKPQKEKPKKKVIAPAVDGQDFSKRIVIVLNKELPSWQALNAVGHISAFLGNKMEESFDTGAYFTSQDAEKLPRNSQFPIVTVSAKPGQLQTLYGKVKEAGVLFHVFIKEMIETTNDTDIEKILAGKKLEEIEILGIGIFATNEQAEKLTKNFSLWK